jgi:stage III sporulation protein AB
MIALRIALSLVIALAGYEIGSLVADRQRRRVLEIDAWQALLALLASDVSYTALPLGQALAAAGRSGRGLVQEFAQRLGRRLEGHVLLADAWRDELQRLRPRSCLTVEDAAPLHELGEQLGRYGREEHKGFFQRCQERLGLQRRQALEQSLQGGRMWRTLGAVAGVAVALVLL